MGLLTSKELQRLGRQWTFCTVLAATAATTAAASSAAPAAAAVQRVDALAYEGRDEPAAPAGTCTAPRVSLGWFLAFLGKFLPVSCCSGALHCVSLASHRHCRVHSAARTFAHRKMSRLFHSDDDATLSPREGPYPVTGPAAIKLRPGCCRLVYRDGNGCS